MAHDPFRPLRLEYLENAQKTCAEVERLAAIAAHDENAREQLRRAAHNLRGSGGFYGFHAISEAAAALEELILATQWGDAPSTALFSAAEALCRAIRTAELP